MNDLEKMQFRRDKRSGVEWQLQHLFNNAILSVEQLRDAIKEVYGGIETLALDEMVDILQGAKALKLEWNPSEDRNQLWMVLGKLAEEQRYMFLCLFESEGHPCIMNYFIDTPPSEFLSLVLQVVEGE